MEHPGQVVQSGDWCDCTSLRTSVEKKLKYFNFVLYLQSTEHVFMRPLSEPQMLHFFIISCGALTATLFQPGSQFQ